MVVSCLLINLYLPTDYRSADATERFKDVLGEIVGFISSTAHHFVVVAGDWNTDLRQPGEFTDAVCSFLRELNLSLVDLCFPDSVGFTYLGHDGSKSWLDHIAVSVFVPVLFLYILSGVVKISLIIIHWLFH